MIVKKLLLLFIAPLLFCASCQKKETTFTKVGFYFEDKNAGGDLSYDLYIDDKYEGKISVYSAEPQGTSMLLFRILDDKRHDIDVKNGAVLLTANYLEITKRKTCSGTNRSKALQVSGVNGSKYRQDSNKGYSVYAAFK